MSHSWKVHSGLNLEVTLCSVPNTVPNAISTREQKKLPTPQNTW